MRERSFGKKKYEKDATHLAKRRSTREGRFGKSYEKRRFGKKMRKMGGKMQPTWHRQSQFQTRDEKQTNYDEGKLNRRNHNRFYPTFGNVKKSFLRNMAMSQLRLILDVKCI